MDTGCSGPRNVTRILPLETGLDPQVGLQQPSEPEIEKLIKRVLRGVPLHMAKMAQKIRDMGDAKEGPSILGERPSRDDDSNAGKGKNGRGRRPVHGVLPTGTRDRIERG